MIIEHIYIYIWENVDWKPWFLPWFYHERWWFLWWLTCLKVVKWWFHGDLPWFTDGKLPNDRWKNDKTGNHGCFYHGLWGPYGLVLWTNPIYGGILVGWKCWDMKIHIDISVGRDVYLSIYVFAWLSISLSVHLLFKVWKWTLTVNHTSVVELRSRAHTNWGDEVG